MSDTAGSRRETARSGEAVDQLLLEAGMDDDGLRGVLDGLRGLSAIPPVPSDAVAALMVPAALNQDDVTAPKAVAAPACPPADELAARRRAKRRITLTTLSVAVSLAAGGAVAAASDQGIRDTFGSLNQAVSSFMAGSGGGSSDKPGQSQVTDSAEPGGTASVPAPTSTAPNGQAAADNTSRPSSGPSPDAGPGREGAPVPSSPAAVSPSGITLPADLAPGLPGAGGTGSPEAGSGEPGAGEALNGGAPGSEAPSIPEQLPVPVTPPALPAAGQ